MEKKLYRVYCMKKFNAKGYLITNCPCCMWAKEKVFNDAYRKKMWKQLEKDLKKVV